MSTKKKQEILDVITECKIFRLKTNEALEYIKKETKTKISERTYRRYKKELQESVDNRLEYIIKTEWIDEHLQTFDFLKKIEQEYSKNYNSAESIKVKKSILDSLIKSRANLISYYNKSNMIRNVTNWFESKLEEVNKKEKQTKDNSELLTTYAN